MESESELTPDLRDQARDKGLKIADVYAKGCRSLAACPVAYERPRDLVQLQGIGPKTVGMLETRLKAHCEETGGVYPASPSE
jgi:crossover junction endonuclease MUS81